MNTERLRVLLVDDEPRVLDALRRLLRAQREKWEIHFADSGVSALKMLADRPVDVIVTDMRMPGMSGGQLLRQVRLLYPQTTRVILSGQTDQDDLLEDLGCIHHYLQKPCDPKVVCAAIERTHTLAERLRQPNLRIAANRVISLPPGSQAYRSLVDELGKAAPDLNLVGRIVAGDPALTAKLMQLVNSAFFGSTRQISSAEDAVRHLGIKTLKGVVLTARIFDFIGENSSDADISPLWDASLQIGHAAARAAALAGVDIAVQQRAQLAGTLCLVGRAILLTSHPAIYKTVLQASRDTRTSLNQLELLEFGATQDEVGAYALGKWAFEDQIVDAVAFQSCSPLLTTNPISPLLAFLHAARCAHKPTAGGLDEFNADENEPGYPGVLERAA